MAEEKLSSTQLSKEQLPDSRTESILEHAKQAGKKGLPPVHLWNPDFCGDIDIRIARNGDWFYQGSIFTRLAIVKLFSTILRKDDDDYYLITPVEKFRIQVDDAPFVIVSLDVVNQDGVQCLLMETNTGDQLRVDSDHPLWVNIDSTSEEPSPYVCVRDKLNALISRAVFYELAEISESRKVNGRDCLGVESAGEFFVLGETPS